MLINRQDIIASQFGKYYLANAKKSLLIFALDNSNEHFLKYAFRTQIFSA